MLMSLELENFVPPDQVKMISYQAQTSVLNLGFSQSNISLKFKLQSILFTGLMLHFSECCVKYQMTFSCQGLDTTQMKHLVCVTLYCRLLFVQKQEYFTNC